MSPTTLVSRAFALISLLLAFSSLSAAGAAPQTAGSAQNQPRQVAMLVPLLDVNALQQAANADYSASRFDMTLEKYKQLARANNGAASTLYWLGETYFHLRQYDRAADAFQQSAGSYEEARVRLVETYIAAGQRDKATSVCRQNLAMANSAQTVGRLQSLQKILSGRIPPAPKRSAASGAGAER